MNISQLFNLKGWTISSKEKKYFYDQEFPLKEGNQKKNQFLRLKLIEVKLVEKRKLDGGLKNAH